MNTFEFIPENDFLSPEELRSVLERYLREHLEYCRTRSPYYRKLLGERDFSTFPLDRLAELPLTDKRDLAEHIDEFLACPWEEIEDVVFSSGTTGVPCRVAYSGSDMQRLAYNERRCFHAAGMTPSDRVLLTCTLDRCFVAGLAYYLGVRALGAAAIRNGLNTIESHIEVMKALRPTMIVGVPSFLRHLGLEMRNRGIDTSSVRRLICIGEPVRDEKMRLSGLGEQLGEIWNAPIHSTYASSEIVSSFCECTATCGGHLIPDLAIVEIVDEKGNVLPEGEIGEVTVTPMRVTGMPLIRFRTGDISFLIRERCACGRWSPRLGPILGRRAHMLKCRGTTLYPQVLYSVLDQSPEVAEYYIVASGENLSDRVEAVVALKEPGSSTERIAERLKAKCRLQVPIREVSLEEARRQIFSVSRKPVRFVDLRKKSNLNL